MRFKRGDIIICNTDEQLGFTNKKHYIVGAEVVGVLLITDDNGGITSIYSDTKNFIGLSEYREQMIDEI